MVYLGVPFDSTPFRASPSQLRLEKLCLIAEATDCHSAVLATPAEVFAPSIFISSIIQIFLAIHAVPIMVNLFLHVSSESVLCFGSVRCHSPGHCCVYAFCIFLRVAYLCMRLSFFSSFGFVRCASMLGLNSYLYIFEGLFFFGSCERSASAGFAASLLFSFALRLPI